MLKFLVYLRFCVFNENTRQVSRKGFILHKSFFMNNVWASVGVEDVLKPPGSLPATDRSKSVVLV